MKKVNYPLANVYSQLEPGPVILLSTAYKNKINVMPMSWHTMIDFEPPLVGLIISNRNHTFKMLKSSKECVINIPTVELIKKTIACGNFSGRKIDKFKKIGLTPVAASVVKAPLIDECYVNLECKVVDASMATKYNLFIVKVVKAWMDKRIKNPKIFQHHGQGVFKTSPKKLKLFFRWK